MISRFSAGLLLLVAVAACRGEKKTETRFITGVKECDTYLTRYEDCLGKLSGPSRAEVETSYRTERRALARVARSSASTSADARASFVRSCKRAYEEVKGVCE